MTDFNDTSRRLVAQGYSVIPIIPGEQRPGEFRNGAWIGMTNWQRFCDRAPTELELDIWATWPNPSIGIALGRASGITAIDYDYGSEELRAELVALLPTSPCRKFGSKGFTDFYRGFRHASQNYTCDGVRVIDFLAHGKQTVMPPSIHPKGMSYQWLTDRTLENTPASELPEIPLDYHEQVAAIIAKYQTQPIVKTSKTYTKPDGKPGENGGGFDSYWNDINQYALANLSEWVPQLFPDAKPGAQGGYRVNPDWRGVTKRTGKLSINPSGIRDFGTDEGLSAIDVVMRATGSDMDMAVTWLKGALGMTSGECLFQPEGEAQGVPDIMPDITPDIPAAFTPSKMPWRKTSQRNSATPQPRGGVSPPGGSPPQISADIPDAKGALGMLIDHINATARKRQPVLALGAALCAIGTLAGRKYKSPTDLRTNMYIVALADSGAGKDHARTVIDRILNKELGLAVMLGGDKIASGAGLLSAVHRNPSILFQLDEFGAFLQGITNRHKAPPHLAEILNNMTQLFTTANKTFRGTEYANQKERPRMEIEQPCVSVYGTTVPSNFWKAMESNSAVDGSLARFLALETDQNYPDSQTPSQQPIDPILIDFLKRIKAPPMGGTDMGNNGGLIPDLVTVAYSPGAAIAIRELEIAETKRLLKFESTPFTSFWARWCELTVKVAMIQAIGRNPEDPIIDEDDVTFGLAVTDRSIRLMVQGVERFVADNNAENLAKRVMEVIRKTKDQEISKSALYAKTLFLGRERDNTLKALEESGMIHKEIMQTTGRPKMVYRITR